MNISTITEAGADLVHRGLKFAEADIIRFRTSAEARGFKHTVDECNEQLKLLRGNGAEPGLLSQFAPQLDAFEAGSLAGDGSGENGQLALASEDDEHVSGEGPDVTWAKYVPRPRPKTGDSIIFPDASVGHITSALGYRKDDEQFDVFFRGAEADEDPTVPPTKLAIVRRADEWRSADEERAGTYEERDDMLRERAEDAAQRKLGEDTVVDSDVPVNAETAQGQLAPRSRGKLNRAAAVHKSAPVKPKTKAKSKGKGGKKARS